MKFLFSTKLRFFWVIIPMLAFLSLAISYNTYADGPLKFYPLIVFLGGCVIFTLVFLFRVVGVGFDEVRTIGLFSSRERVMINEGKTLTLTLLPKKKISVELYGNDGVTAELDWIKPGEDGSIPDINLFRAKAIGGRKTLVRILKFYGLSKDEAEALINGSLSYEDELISVRKEKQDEDEGENFKVHIKFLKTV